MVKLRTFDKVVLSLLFLFMLIRAPFIVIPALLIIYMLYSIGRSVKEKMEKDLEKGKKKEMRDRIVALETQVQHMNELLTEYQKKSGDNPDAETKS